MIRRCLSRFSNVDLSIISQVNFFSQSIANHISYCVLRGIGDGDTLRSKEIHVPVADPEGVQGVRLNPPLELNYFIFMGNFRKNGAKLGKQTPFLNLSPLSRNPVSAPDVSPCPTVPSLPTICDELARVITRHISPQMSTTCPRYS